MISCIVLIRGVWNVPYVSAAILFSGMWLRQLHDNLPFYYDDDYDSDIAFAQWMRKNVISFILFCMSKDLFISPSGSFHVCKQHS